MKPQPSSVKNKTIADAKVKESLPTKVAVAVHCVLFRFKQCNLYKKAHNIYNISFGLITLE